MSSLEKLIYFLNYKFIPQTISICTEAPLGAFRSHFNVSVRRLNMQFLQLFKNTKDMGEIRLKILDFMNALL